MIIASVDDIGVGRVIMLARQRRNWRQADLAAAAGVSRALVGLAEAGALERITLRTLRRIAAPLEIRLPLTPLLNGGDIDRLRDRDHARMVEAVVANPAAIRLGRDGEVPVQPLRRERIDRHPRLARRLVDAAYRGW